MIKTLFIILYIILFFIIISKLLISNYKINEVNLVEDKIIKVLDRSLIYMFKGNEYENVKSTAKMVFAIDEKAFLNKVKKEFIKEELDYTNLKEISLNFKGKNYIIYGAPKKELAYNEIYVNYEVHGIDLELIVKVDDIFRKL